MVSKIHCEVSRINDDEKVGAKSFIRKVYLKIALNSPCVNYSASINGFDPLTFDFIYPGSGRTVWSSSNDMNRKNGGHNPQ